MLESRKLKGRSRVVVLVFSAIFSIYHIWTIGFAPLPPLKHRSIHVAGILALIFLLYPLSSYSPQEKPSWLDYFLCVLSIFAGIYTFTQIDIIAMRGGVYLAKDIIVGTLFMVLIFEAARRATGNILISVCLVFIAYAFLGRYAPGILQHMGFSFKRVITHLYLTTEGIFGITTGVAATYVYLFVLFGAFLEKTSLDKFFNDFSLSVAGATRGGPAKVATLASGMMGTISGSAASNVVSTGCFTIPLMKRLGYTPTFAGAVEAAASTGGQIMPPIMGAAGFIIAETLGIPYLKVAIAAAIPAFFYYYSVWMIVDLRSRRINLQGLPKDRVPKISEVLIKQGHLAIPIIFIVYVLAKGYTPTFAASRAILLTIIVSFLRKSTRLSLRGLIEALVLGARRSLSVCIACIVVGFVVGVATLTGIGFRLAVSILSISGGNLLITLLLAMIISIIMGMGLPTSAAYIMSSTVAVGALTRLGIPDLPAHLFIFYFAILAGITPPVAVTAYIGAGMAGARPFETAWNSIKLALAGFIVPYVFIYTPEFILLGDNIFVMLSSIITAIFGIYAVAIAAEGYFRKNLSVIERALYFTGGILLVKPGWLTNFVGIGILIVVLIGGFIQKGLHKEKDRAITTH